MPSKQKINLEKVRAALNTVCPKCGCMITPDRILRIDSQQIQCPQCGELLTLGNVAKCAVSERLSKGGLRVCEIHYALSHHRQL
jgi:predicted RNA-binding Zn-ribbon protein involved in translation (DUF1610 family)